MIFFETRRERFSFWKKKKEKTWRINRFEIRPNLYQKKKKRERKRNVSLINRNNIDNI